MTTDLKDKPSEELNPAQRLQNQETNFDSIAAHYHNDADPSAENTAIARAKNAGTHTDTHGDEVVDNYNSDPNESRDELQNQEQNTPSLYNNNTSNQSKSGKLGGFLRSRKTGPASIIALLLTVGFGGVTVLSGPASLIVMMERVFTNNGTHDVRANGTMMKGRYGVLFGSGGEKDCSTSKIKCKVKSMSKAEVDRIRTIPGVEIREGKSVFGRSIITGLTITEPNGKKVEIRNANEYKTAMKDNPYAARTLWRINNPKAAFFIDQQAKMRDVLKKYKLSANKAFNPSTKRDATERKAENDDRMNQHTGAPSADDGAGSDGRGATDEERRQAITDERDKGLAELDRRYDAGEITDSTRQQGKKAVRDNYDREMANFKPNNRATDGNRNTVRDSMRSAMIEKLKTGPLMSKVSAYGGKVGGKLSNAGDVVSVLCAARNIINGATAIVKLQYYSELFRFAFPFLQAGAQIVDAQTHGGYENGVPKPETIEYIGDRLTWYDKREKNEDGTQNKEYGLTATDSQGFQAALSGDHGKLQSFTEKYAPWYIVGAIAGNGIVDGVESALGGETRVRQICFAGQAASMAGLAACANPIGVIVCASAIAGAYFFADDIVAFATENIVEEAITRIANADLNSTLAGVGLGNALAAAIGLLLMEKNRGSGLIPATTVASASTYFAQTEDTYNEYIASLVDEAKSEPLNPYNQYSFAGQFVAAINPYRAEKTTGFSFMTNLSSVISNSLSITTPSVSAAGYHMPIEAVERPESLQSMTQEGTPGGRSCQDKQMEVFLCDWSGKSVDYMPAEVIQWGMQMGAGDTSPWDEAVDWMSKDQSDKGRDYIDRITGKPTGYDKYPTSFDPETYSEDFDSDNPYLMYKAYCTSDRVYPLGTTAWTGDSLFSPSDQMGTGVKDKMAWHLGYACGGKDSTGNDNAEIQDHLKYFIFYYHMCEVQLGIADGNQKCWEDEPAAQPLASTTAESVTCGTDWRYPIKKPGTTLTRSMGNGHQGADIFRGSPGVAGDPIYAVCDGVVTFAGPETGGFGYWVQLKHEVDGQRYDTLYGHIKPTVKVGDVVKGCQQIGVTASLAEMNEHGGGGGSTGPHLHFEKHPGGYKNPQRPEEILDAAKECG